MANRPRQHLLAHSTHLFLTRPLQGARNAHEWRTLLAYLKTQNRIAPRDPWTAHVGAARLFYDCRRQGITIRSTIDCMIAQMVIERNATLLHADRDFDHIATIAPLKVHLAAATR